MPSFSLDDLIQQHMLLQSQVDDLPPPSPALQALAQLNDVALTSLTDGEVLTWSAADNDWTNAAASGSGFPITYDDGTYTYSIEATGSLLHLKVIQDATPTNLVEFYLEADNLTASLFVANGGLYWDPTTGAHLYADQGVSIDSASNDINVSAGAALFLHAASGGVVLDCSGAQISIEQSTGGGVASLDFNATQAIFRGMVATPSTADMPNNGNFAFWFNATTKELNAVGRDSTGTIVTAVLATLT